MAQPRAFKPVGVDQDGKFPDRVEQHLATEFLTPSSATATYVAVQSTAPDPTKITAWVDNTTSPPTVKGWNGTAWIAIGGGGTVSDATTTAKGVVQLAGDLGGTAAAPTVPGLAGKADLVGGFIPSSQIPSLALNTSVTVASQAAMLALTTTQVQPGDLAIRADGAGTFILTATNPSVLSNWTLLVAPTDVVTTVAGRNGAVVLAKTDVGLDQVDNVSDLNKQISTAQAAVNTAQAAVNTAQAVLNTQVAALPDTFARYVVNGTSTTTPRPAGSGLVIWIGSVASTNMVDGDVRISTS